MKIDGTYKQCGRNDHPCQCAFPVGASDTTLSATSCETNEDCANDRESCAYNTQVGMNSCVSCTAIDNSLVLVLNDTSKCDDLKGRRPAPRSYFPSSNGKTNDLCVRTAQCDGDRSCFQYKDETFTSLVACKGSDNLCFCRERKLTGCKDGSDCETGESCIFSENFGGFIDECVSNAFLASVSANQFFYTGNATKTPDGNGVHLDLCEYDWDCMSPLRCTHVTDEYGGCAGRRGCQCKPLVNSFCSSDSDCTTNGEVCAKYIDGNSRPFCVSANYMDVTTNGLVAVDFKSTKPERPIDTFKLTGDTCIDNSGCSGNRTCKHNTEAFGLCNQRNFCSCVADEPQACNTTADCTTMGELCAEITGVGPIGGTCVSTLSFDADVSGTRREIGVRNTPPPTRTPSPSASPSGEPIPEETPIPTDDEPESTAGPVTIDAGGSPEVEDATPTAESVTDPSGTIPSAEPTPEEENEICVDQKLLEGFAPSELVYKMARRAAVLCDATATCATPGHMVVFRESAMSMQMYCDMHAASGCDKRVRWVNSPRMKYGIRIASTTDGLQMTAHAARYGSELEQVVLSKIIDVFGI